jgi:hypothetical protein
MNELSLKKIKWCCFDEQPWADLDWFQDVVLAAYFETCEEKTVPDFLAFRETQWVEEEIMMPIVAYYAYGNYEAWRYPPDDDDPNPNHFLDVYEDTFSEVENDIFAMAYENHLFLDHFGDFFHVPVVQVW